MADNALLGQVKHQVRHQGNVAAVADAVLARGVVRAGNAAHEQNLFALRELIQRDGNGRSLMIQMSSRMTFCQET